MEVAENRLNELAEMTFSEDRDFDLIFFIPEGVQLYTIDGPDASSPPSAESSLQILKYPEGEASSITPTALIQVGTWLYPLSKETPILFSDSRTLVVPNPTQEKPNLHVGIVLTSRVEEQQVEELSQLLGELASLHEYSPETASQEEKLGKSDKITNYLVSGGERLAGRIQSGAARWNQRIVARGERYRTTVQPKNTPTHITPVVKGGVEYMHKGTKVVAKVTEKLFDKIGDIGSAVGKKVAAGATWIVGDNETAEKSIKMVGGGVAAGGSVLFSMVIAGKTLAKSFSNQTVENVRHRYGEEASQTAKHALHAAGHGGNALIQIHQITPQGIIGRVGMGAGVQTVSDLHVNLVGAPIPLRIPGLVPPAAQPVVEVVTSVPLEKEAGEATTEPQEQKEELKIEILKREETFV